MLSLSIDKKLDYSTPIFFVPLGIPTVQQPVATAKTITPKKTAPTTPPIKNPEKKQATTVASTATQKPTTVATPPSSFAKASADTSAKKANVKSTPIKQEFAKNTEPKIEQKVGPKKEEIKKTDVKSTPVAQALDIEQTVTPMIPANAQISHNYREVEALRKQAQLQKEIVQKWQPPIGVSPDCMCEVSFFINSTGKIENIKMIKNSGVMMFDISVRQTLFAMKMPQWTYGKPFTINFKSSSA